MAAADTSSFSAMSSWVNPAFMRSDRSFSPNSIVPPNWVAFILSKNNFGLKKKVIVVRPKLDYD
jgi:hypothetical protein